MEGLLEVSHDYEETSRTKYVGPGRGGPNRPKTTEWSVRYQITTVRRDEPAIARHVARMGWQLQVTNAPAVRLSLGDSLLAYRGGLCLERAFHLLKDQPLGIRPLFVRRDDQVQGLTHLVTLALRVLTLFEVLVRRGQEQSGEKLKGLYPGQAKRTTDRPTAKRVLEAIARARDHADPGGERGRLSLASDAPAESGEAGAGLPGAVRGGIHTISHKFHLSTLSIRERGEFLFNSLASLPLPGERRVCPPPSREEQSQYPIAAPSLRGSEPPIRTPCSTSIRIAW